MTLEQRLEENLAQQARLVQASQDLAAQQTNVHQQFIALKGAESVLRDLISALPEPSAETPA